MLQLIDKKSKLFLYIAVFFLLGTINNKSFIANKIPAKKTNNIIVSGLSNENNLEVANELKTELLENIFFIDKKKINEILYSNNLIHSFRAKKIYPNLIKINIKKAEFLAVINNDNQNFFIGSNAKLIKANNLKKELPYIFGKIDYKKFLEFKYVIDESKFEYNEIVSIFFFPSNRWDIKTKDNILIKLPEKNLSNALRIAYKIKNNEQFKMKKTIDLRVPNQVIISE